MKGQGILRRKVGKARSHVTLVPRWIELNVSEEYGSGQSWDGRDLFRLLTSEYQKSMYCLTSNGELLTLDTEPFTRERYKRANTITLYPAHYFPND